MYHISSLPSSQQHKSDHHFFIQKISFVAFFLPASVIKFWYLSWLWKKSDSSAAHSDINANIASSMLMRYSKLISFILPAFTPMPLLSLGVVPRKAFRTSSWARTILLIRELKTWLLPYPVIAAPRVPVNAAPRIAVNNFVIIIHFYMIICNNDNRQSKKVERLVTR